MDRKASSAHSVAMRHDNGDKIVIKKNYNGHWIYASALGNSGEGSIVDFVQHWKGCKLGRARQELRPWVGQGENVSRPPESTYAPSVKPSSKDRLRVLDEFERMHPARRHPYLELERGIPAAVLGLPRFAGKIYMDERRNAVFPHWDRDGVCGFEIKNSGFTGFSKGGEKGLWVSACRKTDSALVIAESAIDSLSYAILHPNASARYASIGGKMSPGQPALIRAAIKRMPQGAVIIAATDNDSGGHELAEEIGQIVKAASRADPVFKSHWPDGEGQDWNERLKSCPAEPAPGPLFKP